MDPTGPNNSQVSFTDHFRSMGVEDEDVMRDVMEALIRDTLDHLPPLAKAIRDRDAEAAARLSHYCKGACASAGAHTAAESLRSIELHSRALEFEACAALLSRVEAEIARIDEFAHPPYSFKQWGSGI